VSQFGVVKKSTAERRETWLRSARDLGAAAR